MERWWVAGLLLQHHPRTSLYYFSSSPYLKWLTYRRHCQKVVKVIFAEDVVFNIQPTPTCAFTFLGLCNNLHDCDISYDIALWKASLILTWLFGMQLLLLPHWNSTLGSHAKYAESQKLLLVIYSLQWQQSFRNISPEETEFAKKDNISCHICISTGKIDNIYKLFYCKVFSKFH